MSLAPAANMATTESTTLIDLVDLGLEDTNSTNNVQDLSPDISKELYDTIIFTNQIVIGQIIAVFGTGTNMVNLVVFYKMAFKEAINISLFSLAITDFVSCLTAMWNGISYTLVHLKADVPFRPLEINYMFGGYAHVMATNISGCITAYIALERCLCVTFPLKIKHMITPRKVTMIIASFWVLIIGLYSGAFFVNRLDWKLDPNTNKTQLGLIRVNEEIEARVYALRSVVLPLITFFMTTISTILLVVNLKRKAEWRSKTASISKGNQVSSRDKRVATLVVFVAILFISCYAPHTILVLVTLFEPEFSWHGRYGLLNGVAYSFVYILESTNASMNIFIYYLRSSNYKTKFDFSILKKKDPKA